MKGTQTSIVYSKEFKEARHFFFAFYYVFKSEIDIMDFYILSEKNNMPM